MTIKVIHFPTFIASMDRAEWAPFEDGLTLAEIIIGKKEKVPDEYDFYVDIEGVPIPHDQWHLVTPHDGTTVTVRPMARGGGGSDAKQILTAVAAIAILVAAVYFGGPLGAALFPSLAEATATALGTAIISTAGTLALYAIAPPANPDALGTIADSLGTTSPNYNISGAQNALRPWGVVPLILGRNRVTPPLGAKTYTELRGNKNHYFRMLAVWGYGRLDVSDIKIGESDLAGFEEVNEETVDGSSLQSLTTFPDQVTEDSLSILLVHDDGFQTRTTVDNTDELSVDITFPQGLFELDPDTGKKSERTVNVDIEYRLVGAGSWTATAGISVTAKKNQAFGRNLTWSVTRGQYDVRVQRNTGDSSKDTIYDQVYWTALRAIRDEDPIQFPKPLAKTALIIKATEQLNGVVDDLNAIVQSYAQTWNGSVWSENLTSNPASLYRLILQGPTISRPVSDAEINLSDLAYWYDYCVTKGFEFNMIIDFEASLWDVLKMICAAGTASPAIRDGLWTIVIDEPKAVIASHFSPHNMTKFEGEITYAELPHAWRCGFINKTNDLYVRDERIVYRTGYSASNATVYESVDFPGVTSPTQVYRLATRHLAVMQLRPQKFTFEVGIQNLLCQRGDRIKVVHDAPEWGVGSARIKQVIGDGGAPEYIQTIVVDNGLQMETGNNYAMRVQRQDGTSQYIEIITFAGYQTSVNVVLQTVLMSAAPDVGDMILFGIADQESVDLIVSGIQPLDDLTARLICLDYSPEIYDVDSEVVPAYNPHITTPASVGSKPSPPIIASIQSDITVATLGSDGSVLEQALVTVKPPSGLDPTEVDVQGQSRPQGTDEWSDIFTQARPDYVYIADVTGGDIFDLRVRFKTTAASRTPGAVSDWTTQMDYTVIGKTDLPPDPINFKVEGTRVVWTLPSFPLDLAGFELRFNYGTLVAWDQGIPVQDHVITTTDYDLSWLKGGIFTLMVKALDTGDRESANFAALVVDLGDVAFGNIYKTVDYKADGFGLGIYGTVTGGSISGGNLVADVLSGFWQAGGAAFWQAGGEDFWQDNAVEMTYETYYTTEIAEIGIEMGLLTTIQARQYSLSYRTDGDALFFTGDDSATLFTSVTHGGLGPDEIIFNDLGPWRLWPGKLTVIGHQRYYFQVVTAAGTIQGQITQFEVSLDVPDISEELNDVAISAGGTRLAITNTYTVIKLVIASIQDDAGSAVYAKVMDKDATNGPLIKCFDTSGTAVAGTVDARVVGYNV